MKRLLASVVGLSFAVALCVHKAEAILEGPPGSALAQAFLYYGVQRTFPTQYMFINTDLVAPPNRVIEILVAPNGNDDFETNPQWYKGFTPQSAFRSAQGCYNYIQQVFTMNGVLPICRITAGNYVGKIEITGAPHGRQIQGGGQITLWGTCANTNSPNNGRVGLVSGAADVVLISDSWVAQPVQTLISVINGAFLQVTCVTTSADVYHFAAQQYSNIIINSSVRTIIGPGGSTVSVISAENLGQVYASGMTVIGGTSGAFARAASGGSVVFYGAAASIVFSGTPSFAVTLQAIDHGYINIANANRMSGAATGSAKCSITYGSLLVSGATGASVPGGGACTVDAATFSLER